MDVKAGLIDFLRNEVLEDASFEINEQDQLLSEGIIDSLGLMRTIRFIEKAYDISISFEDITLENFNSVISIQDYINKVIN